MPLRSALPLALLLAIAACGGSSVGADEIEPLPETDAVAVAAMLDASDRPVVLNVWASWCTPCRSEAPLLRRAHDEFGDDVRFLGVDVRDSQEGARAFIAEFGLEGFDHLFDPSGEVPASLGGFGVPLTFFFEADGTMQRLHSGVLDERTLALQIDELIRAGG